MQKNNFVVSAQLIEVNMTSKSLPSFYLRLKIRDKDKSEQEFRLYGDDDLLSLPIGFIRGSAVEKISSNDGLSLIFFKKYASLEINGAVAIGQKKKVNKRWTKCASTVFYGI